MSRDDAHKLLGGYATGTLTAEEQRALFEAALQDQELFDALAREQALRELLGDPAARAQLLMAVDEAPAPWHRRWWRLAPVAAMAAAIAVVAVVELRQNSPTPRLLPRAKLQAPAVAAQPAPILPPPPELARAAPAALAPFSLPGAAPAAPPPPPPPTAQAAVPAPSSAGSLAPPPLAQPAFGALPRPTAVPPPSGAPPPAPQAVRPAFGAPPPAPQAVRPAFGAAPAVLARSAETVTVTAESQPLAVSSSGAVTSTPTPRQLADLPPAARDAQTLFYGAGPASNLRGTVAAPQGFVAAAGQILAPPPANLGIQYRVLRRMPDGDFVDVEADGSLAAGTAVKLEITPNNNGYLRVLENQPNGVWREVVNRPVERMNAFETDLLRYQEAGRRDLQVVFSRRPFQTPAGAVATAPPVEAVKNDVATATVTAGLGGAGSGGRGGGGRGGGDAVLPQPRVSFAANRDASADAVSVTITLNIR